MIYIETNYFFFPYLKFVLHIHPLKLSAEIIANIDVISGEKHYMDKVATNAVV